MFCSRRTFSSQKPILFALIVALCVPALAYAGDVHPVFNLQSTTQSPFPSDLFTVRDLRQNTGLRVNLPLPDCTTHLSDCSDTALLNQLDGFNPQPRLSIPFDGPIDISTVNSKTIFLVKIPGRGMREGEEEFEHFRPQVVGINQIVWDPASLTLFAESDDHLDQHSNYLLVVTTGVHAADGSAIVPSDEFRDFRHDDDFGQSKNRQLEAYRHLLIEAMDEDVLERIGLSRRHIAAASVFTTESITATLENISDQIKHAPAPAVAFNLGTNGETTVFPLNTVSNISFQPQVLVVGPKPSTNLPIAALQAIPGSIATVAFGKFKASNWETADAIIPAAPTRTSVPVQGSEDLYFNLFIPAGPRPSSGWPVAIFGHGFGDSKQGGPYAVASVLASSGIATISINVVGHGFGPQGTLTVTAGANTVVLSAGGRGVDLNGDGKIDSTEGSTTLPVGPFAAIGSRDGLQQTVADLMQLVRAIQGGIDTSGGGLPDLDASRVYYFGQSFGGIYGTIFLGIESDIKAGVPNVPGGSITDIVRMGGFRPLLAQLLSLRSPSLLNALPPNFFNDNKPLRDEAPLVNTVPGAIAIQTVEDNSIWLGQSGDPVAWAPFIRKSPLPGNAPKRVIIQFARGDQTVPNPTATALIRSGDLADRATFFRNDVAAPLGLGFSNPHAFLTALPKIAALEGQLQIAAFLASDGALTLDPDSFAPALGVPPSVPSLFETPVVTLPEDLGFAHTFPLP
jgi:hypothetical protein